MDVVQRESIMVIDAVAADDVFSELLDHRGTCCHPVAAKGTHEPNLVVSDTGVVEFG
jgi:hypothetical protein